MFHLSLAKASLGQILATFSKFQQAYCTVIQVTTVELGSTDSAPQDWLHATCLHHVRIDSIQVIVTDKIASCCKDLLSIEIQMKGWLLNDSFTATFHDLLCNIYATGVKYGEYLVARQKYEIGILATICRFLFLSELNKKRD